MTPPTAPLAASTTTRNPHDNGADTDSLTPGQPGAPARTTSPHDDAGLTCLVDPTISSTDLASDDASDDARDEESHDTHLCALAAPNTDVPDHATIASAIVASIRRGGGAPPDLAIEVRQQCVSYLTLEGYSSCEIAQVMHISERTVRRDRAAVRKDEALVPQVALGDEFLGEFYRLSMASIQRLVRLTNDLEAPHYARLWADEAISRIYDRLMTTARRMGYIEFGGRRLAEDRANDPAERQTLRQKLAAMAEAVRGR